MSILLSIDKNIERYKINNKNILGVGGFMIYRWVGGSRGKGKIFFIIGGYILLYMMYIFLEDYN